MPRSHSLPRRFLAVSLVALAGAWSIGCSPKPAPSPSPTAAFASEEEAFAAAEATYRAYLDTLNAVDLTDPATFEPVFQHTTGAFQRGDRRNLSEMRAEGLQISGLNVLTGFVGIEASPTTNFVVARICVDVSDVKIVDEAGASYVDADRPPTYVVDATFVARAEHLLIQSAERSEATTCG